MDHRRICSDLCTVCGVVVMFKFFWSITPIGAAVNLLRIAREHENREVRNVAIGWCPGDDYIEDISTPEDRREYYRVIRKRRDVKEPIKAKLPKLVKAYED